MTQRVQLINEFTVDWPLRGGPHGSDRTRPENWGLPEALTARIHAWAASFHEHYSWKGGWDDSEHERAHRIEGQLLRRLLQEQLGSEHEVELRLWECAPTPRIA